MELEEDDTIFKCVSVLQARAPPPAPGQTPTAASASATGAAMGSVRGHSLMRDGFMGLKR